MQRYHIRTGRYDKIIYQGTLAGVVLVSTTGREHARIDRLYLRPSCQGAGIGSLVLDLIEHKYPQVTNWSLDSIRNNTLSTLKVRLRLSETHLKRVRFRQP